MEIDDRPHYRRMQVLRRLSMTCRAMRLRLLPWIWDFILLSRRCHARDSKTSSISWESTTTALASYVDASLTARVRYFRASLIHESRLIPVLSRFMTLHFLDDGAIRPFVRCLSFLPNLHTLAIGSVDYGPSPVLLKKALGRIRLPQIKTLIIPESAHPLLEHCRNVEDVVWVISDRRRAYNDFLQSFVSNSGSKVKRLTIPLTLPQSRPPRKRSKTLHLRRVGMTTDRLQH